MRSYGLTKTLRAEGLLEGCLGVAAFPMTGESWWLFAALALAPDLSMFGYLINPRFGATLYNAVHSTIGPCVLAIAGLVLGHPLALAVASVWIAHIGFDRALAYGLKSWRGFKYTHLGEIGGPCAGNAG
jgi:Domain of unknown function (DUF4260)